MYILLLDYLYKIEQSFDGMKGESMALYNYECSEHGLVVLDLKLGTNKETEICPKCGKKMNRVYSAIGNMWKCDGAFGKSQ